MSIEEEKSLRELLTDVIEERMRLDSEIHHEHHEFIQSMISRERIKAERWEELNRQVIGWGVVLFISTIGGWVINHSEQVGKWIAGVR